MAVRSSRSLALIAGVLGTLSLTQSCVDDGVSLHVICPIAPATSDTGCTWDPTAGKCTPTGVLNVLSAPGYGFNLMVESGLKPRERDVPPQGEPNGIEVLSAHVELRSVDGKLILFPASNGQAVPNPATVPATGYIDPMTRAAVAVTVISYAQVQGLQNYNASQIIAAVKIKGRTNGNVVVESSEFQWPIQLEKLSPDPAIGKCIAANFCPGYEGQDDFANVCHANAQTQ